MSTVSSLDNQNKVIRLTASTTATALGAMQIALSIPGWPAWAFVGRIQVTATSPFSALTTTIVSDAAAYLAATGGAQARFVQQSHADAANAVSVSTFDFGGGYSEDASKVGFLSLVLSSGTAFATGTVFTVVADARRAQPFLAADNDGSGRRYDYSFRVLRQSTGGVNDLSTSLRNLAAFAAPTLPSEVGVTALSASTEYLYVGSAQLFSRLAFVVGTGLPVGVGVVAEYWNGSSWASITPLDNTSDQQVTPSGFSYSGLWTITPPAGWAAQKLSFDPLTVEENAIIAGTQQPTNGLINPARYYVRFHSPNQSTPLTLRLVTALL